MPLIYKPIQCTKEDTNGDKTRHPTLVKPGQVTNTQMLSERLSLMSTLTPGDIHAVLRNLPFVIKDELLNGHTVKPEGLGCFTLKAHTRGKGVLTKEEVRKPD